MATNTMPPTSQPGRRPDEEDGENRFYRGVSFASTSYVPWVYGKLRLGRCNTSRLQESGCPVLRSHNPDSLVGAVLNVGKSGGLWKSDWRLPKKPWNTDTFDQLDSGVLRGISVGGHLDFDTLTVDNEGKAKTVDEMLFTCDFVLVEESLTAQPADTKASVDRMLADVLRRDNPAIFDTIISPEGIFTTATQDLYRRVDSLRQSHNDAIRRAAQTMTTPALETPTHESIQRAIAAELERSEALKGLAELPAQFAKMEADRQLELAKNMEYRAKLDKIQYQPAGAVLQMSNWVPGKDHALDLGKIIRLTAPDDIGFPALDRAEASLEESFLEQLTLGNPGRNTAARIPFQVIEERARQLQLQRNTVAGGAGARGVDINVLGDGGLLLNDFSPILSAMNVRQGLSGGQKLPWWTSQGAAAGGAEGSAIAVETWTLDDAELLPVSLGTAFEISTSLRGTDDNTFSGLVFMAVHQVISDEMVGQVLDGGGSTVNEIAGLWGRVSTATPDRTVEYGAGQGDFTRADILATKNLVDLSKSDGGPGIFILGTTMWQLAEGTLRGGSSSDKYLLEPMGMDSMMMMGQMGMVEGRMACHYKDFAPSSITDGGLYIKPQRCTIFVWGDSFVLEEVTILARKNQFKLVVECNLGVVQPDYNLAAIRQT